MTILLKLSSSANYPGGDTLGTVEGVDRNLGGFPISPFPQTIPYRYR